MRIGTAVVLAVLLVVSINAPALAQDRAAFFQRYTPADPVAFESEIAELRTELAQLRSLGQPRAALRSAAELGGMLVSARKEREAQVLLEQTLQESRRLQAHEATGWALLYLATANQYLGAPAVALTQFDEALCLAVAHRDAELEHYVLHHRARLKVELGDLPSARGDFERALVLWIRLGDQDRAASTRRALQALASRSADKKSETRPSACP